MEPKGVSGGYTERCFSLHCLNPTEGIYNNDNDNNIIDNNN